LEVFWKQFFDALITSFAMPSTQYLAGIALPRKEAAEQEEAAEGATRKEQLQSKRPQRRQDRS
jgi:hypothetical protein